MKKLISLFVPVLLLVCLFTYPSCKSKYHATLPTPANFRLLGYTKITTKSIIAPITATPVVTETYSFAYDGNNRLSMILFATNDSNQKKLGLLDERMIFTYNGSTIYRTVTNLESASVVEIDTFNVNGYNQLTSSYFPWESHTFNYQGALITQQKDTYFDSGTTVSATTYFTSDNHDLLHQLFNGTLNATFPDSGIRPDITPIDTARDSILSFPLTVTWTAYGSGPYVTTHTTNTNSDALSGYSENLIRVDAVDPNLIFVRPVYFPAGLATSRFYQIYDFLPNRIGDYLQLETFKTYGISIYQNQHLLKQMTTAYDTTFVTYDIDGQSKVTQTHVLIKDKLGNSTRYEYKLQYDTN